MYNFPSSPSNGQNFTPVTGGPTYVFDGVVWKVTSGGVAGVWIGDTPPLAPVSGQLWFQSSTGNTYIWYPDVDSSAWVQFNVGPPAGGLFLPERVSAPTTAADQGAIYSKDVSGATELFYRRESSGSETQITKQGRLPVSCSAGLRQTGVGAVDVLVPADWESLDLGVTALGSTAASATLFVLVLVGGASIPAANYQGTTWYISSTFTGSVWSTAGAIMLSPAVATGAYVSGTVQIRKGGLSGLASVSWAGGFIGPNAAVTGGGYINLSGPISALRCGVGTGTINEGTFRIFWQ